MIAYEVMGPNGPVKLEFVKALAAKFKEQGKNVCVSLPLAGLMPEWQGIGNVPYAKESDVLVLVRNSDAHIEIWSCYKSGPWRRVKLGTIIDRDGIAHLYEVYGKPYGKVAA